MKIVKKSNQKIILTRKEEQVDLQLVLSDNNEIIICDHEQIVYV
jgi:hypothetical protein